MKKQIKIAAISDMHCGHILGLTPPGFRREVEAGTPALERIRLQQVERYNWFANEWEGVKKEGGVDLIIVNGDPVDGHADALGGEERQEALENQIFMASRVIKELYAGCRRVKKVFITGGTTYHTRTRDKSLDLERMLQREIMKDIPCDWSPLPFIEITHENRSFIIKCRHKVSKGNIKQGGGVGGIVRQLTENMLQERRMGDPRIDLLLLSHIHEFNVVPLFDADGRPVYGISTPALQGRGSDYGQRECNGMIHFGFLVITLTPTVSGFDLSIDPHITQLNADKVETTKVTF